MSKLPWYMKTTNAKNSNGSYTINVKLSKVWIIAMKAKIITKHLFRSMTKRLTEDG